MRLTLLYAGTFMLLGTAVIAIIYLLAASGSTIDVRTAVPLPLTTERRPPVPVPPPGATAPGLTAPLSPSTPSPPAD